MKQKEEYRPITGFPGYQVSNHGNIMNKHKRVLKHPLGYGYPMVSLSINNKASTKCVHRLVAIEFLEPVEGKNTINHKDGNKANNYVENLEWCTQKENINHAWETGLCKSHTNYNGGSGKKGKLYKFSEETVNKIKDLRGQGMTYKAIGEELGIWFTSVWRILNQR